MTRRPRINQILALCIFRPPCDVIVVVVVIVVVFAIVIVVWDSRTIGTVGTVGTVGDGKPVLPDRLLSGVHVHFPRRARVKCMQAFLKHVCPVLHQTYYFHS